MNPTHWTKRPQPVFSKDEAVGVYGPGHNGFFTDSGGQPWLIYHATKFKGAGWNREIHMQPFHWDEQGQPLLDPPGCRAPTDSPVLMGTPVWGGQRHGWRREPCTRPPGRKARRASFDPSNSPHNSARSTGSYIGLTTQQ